MNMSKDEMLKHYEEKREEAYTKLKKIFDVIEDANVQGGIEASCRMQDRYSYQIDYLIERVNFYGDQIKYLINK